MIELIVRGSRVVTADGVRAAAVHIRDGRIAAVRPFANTPAGVHTIEAGNFVVLPGLVDTHVHINEPGRTDWEGFETATVASAAGGVTTLVDMPLNSIPSTVDVEALEAKRRAAEGRIWVDVGFWGGVIPGNASQIQPLLRAGVLGFKCFLVPSGVDEFPHVTMSDLRLALPELAETRAPLLVHAELPGPITDALESLRASGADFRRYDNYLASRPKESENAAIESMLWLCGEYGARVHIVHLSSADALSHLQLARASGLPVTVETCPHYLFFTAEDIPDGATQFKCAPPIRDRGNRERLWRGLTNGEIDMIVTDHSPAPPALKCLESGNFDRAWGGVASLQLGLSAVWTVARTRGVTLERVAGWMSGAPARLAGLRRKGVIAPGYDADLIVWDPEAVWTVTEDSIRHRHKLTPYLGARLAGVVQMTMLRGNVVYERGQMAGSPGGRILEWSRT